jgi:hypothetical protein
MDLEPDEMAIVLRGARIVADEDRDAFFSDVARRLSHVRDIVP